MSKMGPGFDPDAYAPVAERIRLFYERHPLGRIETELVSRSEKEIVFKALVYRTATDEHPAATGWAAEREGDGDINLVACLENTETSAIGRALANLGFTASRERPSAEEMAKSWRARARLAGPNASRRPRNAPPLRIPAEPEPEIAIDDDPLQRRANELADALALVGVAQRMGLRSARAAWLRGRLVSGAAAPEVLERWAGVLRRWVEKRRDDLVEGVSLD
ncbi:MAG TPA: hypothetical protein VJU87_00070 [Gemmatimonadaceae bacterium]|nr:hypothetical protein [Gemmatimonadaceae bacterium]